MIRLAQNKDLDSLMELLHQVNDIHADGRPDLFIKGHTKYSPYEVLGIIGNPDTPVFVFADDNGEVEGYCFCIVQDNTQSKHVVPIKTLYIDDLCVDKDCRSKHIGSQLYFHVREYAKANGFHNITLNVWQCNPTAMKFYESIGLKPMKVGMEDILQPS